MKNAALYLIAPAAALCLGACETTGDPNAGGLFGWSETKAQQRLADRETTLADRQRGLRSERETARDLSRTRQELAQRQADAARRPKPPVPRDDAQFESALAEAVALERAAPTSSGASRARRVREEIEAVRADRSATPSQRTSRLRELTRELARLRAAFG